MDHHHVNNETFKIPAHFVRICIMAIVLGCLAFVYALKFYPERAWANVLINNFYFVSLSLSGGFVIALQYVLSSSSIAPFKRIGEAMTGFLPVGLILMLLMLLGVHSIYEWTHTDVVAKDHILHAKSAFLNMKFFVVRLLIFFGIWIATTKAMVGLSRKQDKDGSNTSNRSKQTLAAVIFLITFAFSFSLASFDWIMSIDAHWFSTVFAIYCFSGMFVNGLVFIALSLMVLEHLGYMKGVVNENHYHDLGKMIFGFSTFWAYIWFCQYVLIWYSNIPEETAYYMTRTQRDWDWPFYVNFLINWLIPFFALMKRDSKRSRWILMRVCILLLVAHWFDLYVMVAPKVFEHGNKTHSIGPVEILMALGMAGLFVWVLMKKLTKASLVASNDPYLEEGIHLHQ